ncbi:MAG: hypothetical protein LC729_02365 [Acidobacteria bacterium]|nr:hypothetical protein [Acidobacteriota bacterium]
MKSGRLRRRPGETKIRRPRHGREGLHAEQGREGEVPHDREHPVASARRPLPLPGERALDTDPSRR